MIKTAYIMAIIYHHIYLYIFIYKFYYTYLYKFIWWNQQAWNHHAILHLWFLRTWISMIIKLLFLLWHKVSTHTHTHIEMHTPTYRTKANLCAHTHTHTHTSVWIELLPRGSSSKWQSVQWGEARCILSANVIHITGQVAACFGVMFTWYQYLQWTNTITQHCHSNCHRPQKAIIVTVTLIRAIWSMRTTQFTEIPCKALTQVHIHHANT